MKKRGRPPKGTKAMTGAERNRIYRAKKLAAKPKRKAMTGAERQRKLRNARKVEKIGRLILKGGDATASTWLSQWVEAISCEGNAEALAWNRIGGDIFFKTPHHQPWE
jgi:hypothetical protein